MDSFVNPGRTLTAYQVTEDVRSGDVVKVKELIGVAANTVKAGEKVTLYLEGTVRVRVDGVADNFDVGDSVYYDDATKKITKTKSGKIFLGFCVRPKYKDQSNGLPEVINVKLSL